MSVLVRGMEMPKNCAECRFCVNGFIDDAPMYECACQSYDNVSVLVDKEGQPFDFRPDWCPLIEVQSPHGRLIDKDKLRRELFWNFNGERIPFYDCDNFPTTLTYRDLHSILSEQPTIIEAEVEDVSSRTRQLARQAGKILVDAALNAIKESEGSEDENNNV